MRGWTSGRMRAWAVGVAVVAALGMVPSLARGAGSSSHANGLIAFDSYECSPDSGQNCHFVYLTNDTGAVTVRGAVGAGPAFSPDGVHYAYTGGTPGGIHVTDIAGLSDVSVVPNAGGRLSWMPDGAHLVFSDGNAVKESDLSGNVHTLFTLAPQPGTTTAGASQRDLSVSPDGRRVAMALNTIETNQLVHTEVFVANIDGSGLHQVTTTPTGQLASYQSYNGAFFPSWSPDGTRLVYSFIVSAGNFNSYFRLATISPDGGAATVFPQQPADKASYSPDGTQIIFNDLQRGLARMNADGTGQQQIPAGPNGPPNLGLPINPASPVSISVLGHTAGDAPSWGPVPNCAILTPYLAAYASLLAPACAALNLG